ncbi:hypothetical protein DC429_03615 [Arthrobacter sp. TPD3018]|nr:hypothetical protein DC425_03610 [Sphingomonas sp. TPD3009]PVE61019.1 hypothetical protein DC429_03615 [Arthrobacter sp. TPD3018]PVE86066.1 hypothetical protein DC431_09565 [Sphingomonas melonis]
MKRAKRRSVRTTCAGYSVPPPPSFPRRRESRHANGSDGAETPRHMDSRLRGNDDVIRVASCDQQPRAGT